VIAARRLPPRSRFVYATLGIAAFVVFMGTIGRASFQPKTFEYDLVPFYCGGVVVAERHDPYLVEPLRTCEHAIGPVFRKGTQLVVPDPLPAYDQALFAVLSRLPYLALQVLWFVLELVVCWLTALLLVRLSGLSWLVVGSTLVVSDLYCSTILGQLAPFSLLGLVLAGWGLEKRRATAVTGGLMLALIEPHLGLPALLAVLVWGGRMRVAALVAAAVLGAVSLLALPLPTLVEYFARAIPAHALSEVNNEDQLSSAYLLHQLGVSEALAVLLAKFDYVVMLGLGVALAGRAARTFGPAMIPFGATAFVLLGGPFLHVTQIPAALPAALLVAGRARSRQAGGVAAVLAIPWVNFSTVLTILPVAAGAFYVAARRLWKIGAVRAAIVVSLAIIAEAAAALYVAFDPIQHIPNYGIVLPTDLAESTWKTIIDQQQHRHVLLATIAKIPTELALLALAAVIARAALLPKAEAAAA